MQYQFISVFIDESYVAELFNDLDKVIERIRTSIDALNSWYAFETQAEIISRVKMTEEQFKQHMETALSQTGQDVIEPEIESIVEQMLDFCRNELKA